MMTKSKYRIDYEQEKRQDRLTEENLENFLKNDGTFAGGGEGVG
jgi:hypothetical protein